MDIKSNMRMIGVMNAGRKVQEFENVPRLSEQERLNYASKIATARKIRGWRQDELAEAAGVARTTVVNVERGKTVPQMEVLWRLMTALDMTGDFGAPQPEWIEQYFRIMAPLMQRIPEAQRAAVMSEVITRLAAATVSK